MTEVLTLHPTWVAAAAAATGTPPEAVARRIADAPRLFAAQTFLDDARRVHGRIRRGAPWWRSDGAHRVFVEFDAPNRGRVEALYFLSGKV